MEKRCKEEGCEKLIRARGWCSTHYARWRRAQPSPIILPAPLRFWANVDKAGPSDCWLWTGSINSEGYGKLSIKQATVAAHRFSYELANGSIPPGYEIDHTCHNTARCADGAQCLHRRCVNPAHLEAVTGAVNKRRSPNTTQGRSHCSQGHPYAGDNLVIDSRGMRKCRACRDATLRRFVARKRGVA